MPSKYGKKLPRQSTHVASILRPDILRQPALSYGTLGHFLNPLGDPSKQHLLGPDLSYRVSS